MEELKLYNLPQRVEGGIPISGFKDQKSDKPVTLYFDHMDGMYANLRINDTKDILSVHAATDLIYEDGKYRFAGEIGG